MNKVPFKREKVKLADVQARLAKSPGWTSLAAFVKFLDMLDPTTFEVYYEEENGQNGGREGYRVVHYPGPIPEGNVGRWRDTFQTWFGLGGWMT